MSSNFSFISSGDNPFLHLQKKAVKIDQTPIVGSWATLELQPDLFAPQSFTVGVVIQADNDRVNYHLLSDFRKFECLYGTHFPKSTISELFAQAEECLRMAAQNRIGLIDIDFGTSNLRLSNPVFTSGTSIEGIIKRLYEDVVVLKPHNIKPIRYFDTIDTPTVRKMVNEKLKEIAALDYEKIVIDSGAGFLVKDGDKSHHLDFNLRTSSACGSVVSAVYKTVPTIEMNLLRANLDLTTYCRINKLSSRGVFLMLPEQDKLEPKEWRKVEDIVGEQRWKLERDGFRVAAFDTPSKIASEVYEWAKPTL
jgi:hypothetical protein